MEKLTLSLAILLGLGFLAAKLGQLFKLPSVTGYILAGLAMGPSGLHLVSEQMVGERLEHFTQMALMLIAFGIGEHLEIRRLRQVAKSVGLIGLAETSGSFLFVGTGTFLAAMATSVGQAHWTVVDYAILALLLGAVSVATAPAATLHVMRELGAKGPLTTTLMAVVAVDDGIAIMFFGIALAMAKQLTGAGGASPLLAAAGGTVEILFSLAIGIAAGLMIDFLVHRLRSHGEMLTVGLAILLLCGEVARILHLSPLLAGMAAGFTIVNRDRRDVRIFRSINAFEPPIYVLFFTLAGAHLKLTALVAAGWVGLVYFLLRVIGKMAGANIGARLGGAAPVVRNLLGLALVPQAGVAIGLIFLIRGVDSLSAFSDVIIPVVLAAVVLSELSGPLCARVAVTRAGEATALQGTTPQRGPAEERAASMDERGVDPLELIPWRWEKLPAPVNPKGYVIFGVSHEETAPGLARIATFLAHHHQALPLAVRVVDPLEHASNSRGQRAMERAAREVEEMGYSLQMRKVPADSVREGILSAARQLRCFAVVMGHTLSKSATGAHRVADEVAEQAPCPVVVVRFMGVLHTERILIPVVDDGELDVVEGVVLALSSIGWHQLTLLRMLPAGASKQEAGEAERHLRDWAAHHGISIPLEARALISEAWVQDLRREALLHDMLVMADTPSAFFRRVFFGSLAKDVARACPRPILLVHPASDDGTRHRG